MLMVDYNNVKIVSFNCRGIKSSLGEIQLLCNTYDIVMLQETWLCENEFMFLNTISTEFYTSGIYAMDASEVISNGRPHGGLAILWRKSIAKHCFLVAYDDTRIMGINVKNECKQLLLLNVYLPYDDGTNVDDYKFYLNKIESSIEESVTPYVAICGDFNANIRNCAHRFGKELIRFCDNSGLYISDKILNIDIDRFTYVSDAHGTVSWIDHIVTTLSAHKIINDIYVLNDYVTSDHLPLVMEVSLNLIKLTSSGEGRTGIPSGIKWDSLTKEDVADYKHTTSELLSDVYIDHSLFLCNNSKCCDHLHIEAIDRLYSEITGALLGASETLCRKNNGNYKQVLGWNDICKEGHSQARSAFLVWVQASKPRCGVVYDSMRKSRAHFKLLLRQCRSDYNRLHSDSLAEKLLSKDSKAFWKEIKLLNGCNNSIQSTTINGISDPQGITKSWREYYKELLNSNNDIVNKLYVLNEFDKDNYCSNISYECIFKPADVEAAVKSLKKGKAPGKDTLSSEHIIFSHERLYVILCILLNCCISHGYLPIRLLDAVIVPVIKNKKGDITDMNNYRPIALVCIISKIFELMILNYCEDLLGTSSNQFGFKTKSSTDLCIFTLKQVVESYRASNSPVYLAFLDASKAFDRINHWLLFKKLLLRNIDVLLVRILYVWYSTQLMYVKWGNCVSVPFNVKNGVRQGGVLSPALFNIYVDELSNLLLKCKTGCNINGVFVNHIMYADDTVLITPSPNALQKLINECELFAKESGIIFNALKTKLMCIKPTKLKNLNIPCIVLDNTPLKLVDAVKYLGVFLTDDLRDDTDIKRELRSVYARGNVIIKNFKNCCVNIKCLLFKTYCTGLYASQLWWNFNKRTAKRIQVAYNTVFRFLMFLERRASVSGAMVAENISPFKVLLRKNLGNFKQRLDSSHNVIIKTILASNFFLKSSLYRRWTEELYSFNA